MRAYKPLLLGVFISLSLVFVCEASVVTVLFAGAEMRISGEGWILKDRNNVAYMTNKKKKLLVVVFRFSKFPLADKEHILNIIKSHKDTTRIKVREAKRLKQHGLLATVANGTAKTRVTPVHFRLIGIPVQNHAVVVVAYVPVKDEEKHREEIDWILQSLKVREEPRDSR